jgi:hypothetical protein
MHLQQASGEPLLTLPYFSSPQFTSYTPVSSKRYRVEMTIDSGTIAAEADIMEDAVTLLKQLQEAFKKS